MVVVVVAWNKRLRTTTMFPVNEHGATRKGARITRLSGAPRGNTQPETNLGSTSAPERRGQLSMQGGMPSRKQRRSEMDDGSCCVDRQLGPLRDTAGSAEEISRRESIVAQAVRLCSPGVNAAVHAHTSATPHWVLARRDTFIHRPDWQSWRAH